MVKAEMGLSPSLNNLFAFSRPTFSLSSLLNCASSNHRAAGGYLYLVLASTHPWTLNLVLIVESGIITKPLPRLTL